jgi:predicted AAA+ superfamily ATPase
MSTSEINELLERARAIARGSESEDETARAEFESALNRLRSLAGRSPRANAGSRFEDQVAAALLRIPGLSAELSPEVADAKIRPDFVVHRGDETVLVKAKSRPAFARRTARDLAQAMSAYGAQRGAIVVPDRAYSPVANVDLDHNVALVQLGELGSFFNVVRGAQS